mgnify:CR=1 FL=1
MITDEAQKDEGYHCPVCGRTIKKDESTYIRLDPNSEWWLHLFDEGICRECMQKVRAKRKGQL